MQIVISSGHGKYIRGASGFIDEVDEARKVVNKVAELLNGSDVPTWVFHDDVSGTQGENLDRIVKFHNSKQRDLDISVHFNAYETTQGPMGCEVLYVSQAALAEKVSEKIADAAGLQDRGPKKRTDLAFLNNTNEPAILIETCFVDSQVDVNLYRAAFDAICGAICAAVSGVAQPAQPTPPEPLPEPPAKPTVTITKGPSNTLTFKLEPPDSVNVVVKEP
jgi:N-acetylmuramoyl-L-alanine amidase